MECSELTERVVDRLTGRLTEADRRELDGHLAACAACREDALQCERAWTELGQDPEPVVTAEFPPMPYVENIGVRPDIVADYMTKDNLLNQGKSYVAAFTAALLERIQ